MIRDILGQLGFDWKVALANLVNFLIIYYLLRNVVFKKIANAIRERQVVVQKGLDDAKLAEEARVFAEEEKKQIVANAYKDSHLIAEKAEKDRMALMKEARTDAETESLIIKEKHLKELEDHKIEFQKKMELAYVDLVMSGIESMAHKEIRNKESEAFAQSLLK